MLPDISKKNVSVESIANKVVKDEKLLRDLFENVLSDKAVIKYKSLKVLMLLSEQQPSILYSEWDFFVKLLDNENTFLRTIGANTIANLTKIDNKNKFEKIFDKYTGDPIRINNMFIYPGSAVILDNNPLSIVSFFEECNLANESE